MPTKCPQEDERHERTDVDRNRQRPAEEENHSTPSRGIKKSGSMSEEYSEDDSALDVHETSWDIA